MKIIHYTFTKDEIYSLMNMISDEYNIKLTICKSESEALKLGWDLNCGYATNNTIEISYFNINKNKLEKMFITFFHEFAHCKLSNNVFNKIPEFNANNISLMQYELLITYEGLKFAKEKYNIVFSDDTVKWLINENLTYINNIEKEYIKPILSNDNQYTIKQVYI